jgi:DNA-directed RNA polymerase I, II, and III subunit RPABC2
MSKIAENQRVTEPILSKYERARVIGTRALQISGGAPPLIKVPKKNPPFTPIEIAEMELNVGKIPLIIRRHLPNKNYEDWKVNELQDIKENYA